MDIVGWFMAHWLDVTNIIAYAIALASIIVKLTPDPNDDTILAKVIAFLKVISLYKG